MIRELAEYERALHEVEATEEHLHRTLFADAPAVFAHVLEVDGEVAGMAIWFLNYSTWLGAHNLYLEDLYVRPEHRGGGAGPAAAPDAGRDLRAARLPAPRVVGARLEPGARLLRRDRRRGAHRVDPLPGVRRGAGAARATRRPAARDFMDPRGAVRLLRSAAPYGGHQRERRTRRGAEARRDVTGADGEIADAVEIRLPADSAYLSVLRTATAGLAARLDFTLDEIEDLRIAVDEACAMLLPHAVETAQLTCTFELTPRRLDGHRHPADHPRPAARARHLLLDRPHARSPARSTPASTTTAASGSGCASAAARPAHEPVRETSGTGDDGGDVPAARQLGRRRARRSRGRRGDGRSGGRGRRRVGRRRRRDARPQLAAVRRPRADPRAVPPSCRAHRRATRDAARRATPWSSSTCRSSSTWPAGSATAASPTTTSCRSRPSA